jgi:hypothetical protein
MATTRELARRKIELLRAFHRHENPSIVCPESKEFVR